MLPTHAELLDLVQYSYKHCTHSVNELEFIVTHTNHCIVVTFRGTEVRTKEGFWGRLKNKLDIIRDVRVLPWKDKRAPAGQAGFVRGASAVLQKLRSEIRTPGVPIVLSGHSLGGAIAIALLYIMETEGYNCVECVTFGTPKVFYRPWKTKARITMYKYGKDLITYVFAGRHPVKQTKVGKSKTLLPTFSDHGMHKYQEAKANGEINA